jgi:chromate transporter
MQTPSARMRLWEVVGLFLKLGCLSFGGPAAHIALMEHEAVTKRGWLSREHPLDMLAATSLVPGPNATEMAMHIGFVHAGWPGLLAGGAAFIIPAALISLALAAAYKAWGGLPEGAALFYGMNPAVMAVILVATYRLGRTAIRDWRSVALGVACIAAALLGVHEVWVLIGAGLAGAVLYARPGSLAALWLPLVPLLGLAGPLRAGTWRDNRLVQLALFFLRVGATLMGSGMVFYALVQRDVVVRYAWLTRQQLLDAISVGQMTPGPVISSSTFMGYLIAGLPGAVVSTIAIFLPSFLIVAALGPWLPRLRRSRTAKAFLSGVNVAVVALILVVSASLLRAALVDVWTVLILLLGLAALLRLRLGRLWLVLGGALAGLLRYVLVH